MRVLILLVFCLSVIGCGRRGERIHNKDLNQDQLNIVNNNIDIDFVTVDLNTRRSKRNIKPICRGIEGCLRVCEYFDSAKCKQLSVDKVLVFWLNKINVYSQWEQARNDLNLIATLPKVSDFLSNVDKNNQVMEALFNLSIAADCPINDQLNILFRYSPYVTLYLGASEPVEVGSEAAASVGAGKTATAAEVEVATSKEALAAAEVEVATSKEALAAAEVEVATSKEALAAAEDARAGLAVAASQGTRDAAEEEVFAAKTAVEVAEAKLIVAQEAVDAEAVKEDCTSGIEFSPAGSEMAEDAVAAQEIAEKCPELARVELLSGDGGADADDKADHDADEGVGAQAAAAGDTSEMQKQILVSTKKKIMDSQVLYFNLPIFAGYIKKCFGFDAKTFSQLALEIENKTAFDLGDKVISKACSENSQCIRLSYCAMDSELVWKNVKSSIKEIGCDYESFSEMLP